MPQKKYDDKRYISRGKFYVLHLDSEIMSQGIDKLNDGKVGAPFVYSDDCFMAVALFRHTVGVASDNYKESLRIVLEKKTHPNSLQYTKESTK